jgi:hypothetical protein
MERTRKIITLASILVLSNPSLRADDVPAPSETTCEVIVSGSSSTLKSIVVKKVGQNVPKIYHAKNPGCNSAGFDWYVSRHFALKANVGDDLAREFLILAELAYPHYVEIIGAEPKDIETTRMAFIHAKDLESLQATVVDDLGERWIGNGGGVTLPGSFAAYNYPSGTLSYHRHDLSLHEGLHLHQLVVQSRLDTPDRFTEGITHCFANHVYDPEKKRLTVAVFDKATINNPIDAGLRLMREKGIPRIEEIIRKETAPEFYPSAVALYTAFFWSDPERLMKWRIWRDELFQAQANGDDIAKRDMEIMLKLFGASFDELNEQWLAWIRGRQTTFTHADWGWEQWGESLQSYGWPWNKNYFSQMNINLPPGKRLPPDALRMDYPRGPKPPIVGPVELGTDEPSVGCVIDFSLAENRGWAGLGLGVKGRELLRVVVEGNGKLILDGTMLGMAAGQRDVAFPPEVLKAANKSHRVGLTVKIGRTALEVMIAAEADGHGAKMSASYPLSNDERWDLLARPMALLSRDAKHIITPYVEEPPTNSVDLDQPAPANRWCFAADRETYHLCRAAWVLGDKAPASLVNLKEKMLRAMDKSPEIQQPAIADYHRELPLLLRELRNNPSCAAAIACLAPDGVPDEKQHETAAAVKDASGRKSLFDGKTLEGWKVTDFSGRGEVTVEDGAIRMDMGNPMSGITWTGEPPRENYELSLEGMRVRESDFFCTTTFPVGKSPCSLVVGGWGGSVVGLSSVDGYDASENPTTKTIKFEEKKWYRVRIRVTEKAVQAWIDDREVVHQSRAGHRFGIRIEVSRSKPLGIATWNTVGAVRNIRLRDLTPDEIAEGKADAKDDDAEEGN